MSLSRGDQRSARSRRAPRPRSPRSGGHRGQAMATSRPLREPLTACPSAASGTPPRSRAGCASPARASRRPRVRPALVLSSRRPLGDDAGEVVVHPAQAVRARTPRRIRLQRLRMAGGAHTTATPRLKRRILHGFLLRAHGDQGSDSGRNRAGDGTWSTTEARRNSCTCGPRLVPAVHRGHAPGVSRGCHRCMAPAARFTHERGSDRMAPLCHKVTHDTVRHEIPGGFGCVEGCRSRNQTPPPPGTPTPAPTSCTCVVLRSASRQRAREVQ